MFFTDFNYCSIRYSVFRVGGVLLEIFPSLFCTTRRVGVLSASAPTEIFLVWQGWRVRGRGQREGLRGGAFSDPALLPALSLCLGWVPAHPLWRVFPFCSFSPAAGDFQHFENLRMSSHGRERERERGEGSVLGAGLCAS